MVAPVTGAALAEGLDPGEGEEPEGPADGVLPPPWVGGAADGPLEGLGWLVGLLLDGGGGGE